VVGSDPIAMPIVCAEALAQARLATATAAARNTVRLNIE
jgi:hypothetical protein